MKTKALIAVALIAALLLSIGNATAKRDDLYSDYETMTSVVNKILDNYVTDVDDQKLFYGAYEGMLQSLDPYSAFLPPVNKEELEVDTKGEFGGVGIEITLDEHNVLSVITPLEGTPAFEAGVLAGDKIWKIEDESTEGMTLIDAVKRLRGPKGEPVTITVTHQHQPQKPVEVKIVRDIIKVRSIVDVRMVDEKMKIGYVRMTQFQQKTPEELDEAIKQLEEQGMKALVLDLRFNPGGLLTSAIGVCDRFIDEGVIVSTKGRREDSKEVFKAHNAATYKFPLAILISGQSASASEIVSGCIQDHHRGIIVGSRSYGKGSVQTIIPLEHGKSAMRLTTAYYYTPSGRCIHRKQGAAKDDVWGIYPDVKVDMTPEEYVALFKTWRERHIEENARQENTVQGTDQDVNDVKVGAEDQDETVIYDKTVAEPEKEKPMVDKQLEAAKLFLTGQLFQR